MNDIYILIFEYNIENKHLYSNYINLLKKKKYNFIFCLITHIKNIQIVLQLIPTLTRGF